MSEILVAPRWTDHLDALLARRRELLVVAGLICLSLGAVVLLRARASPAQIAPPATLASPPAPVFGTTATPTPATLYVHIAGAVRHPGLYQLPAGSRVADAIDAAGGPRLNAWLDGVNLAQSLADGMKIEVPRRGGAAWGPGLPSATPSDSSGPVNLNTADQAALESIPGVGPVTAAAILEYRARAGGFSSIEELLEVSGIGPATLGAIRTFVTV